MTEFTDQMLIELAKDARKNAYCKYSDFAVGAACIGQSGKTYYGANVENISYPVGICAERSAIASAISHGEKSITKIAVAGASKDKSASSDLRPCGMCLQFMKEFMSSDSTILIADGTDNFNSFKLSDFLPEPFVK